MEVNHDMSDPELKTLLIDKLDYQIKVATAKLSSFGVNVEDLTL